MTLGLTFYCKECRRWIKSGDAAEHRAFGHHLMHRDMLERRAHRLQRFTPTKATDTEDPTEPAESD